MENKTLKFTAYLTIVVLLQILGFQTSLIAQTLSNYIHSREINETQLTESQLLNLGKIQNNLSFVDYDFIQIEDLALFQSGGLVQIYIPESQCQTVVFKAKNVQYFSPNKYSWYGEIEQVDTCSCFEGHLFVLAQDSIKIGYLKIDDVGYTIGDIGGEVNVLGTVDTSYTIELQCSANGENEGISSVEAQDRGGNCDIRVLILYTPAAADFVPNITATATVDLNMTNQFFRNSGLGKDEINLVLADIVGVDFTESSVIKDDLNEFTNSSSTIESIGGVPLATLITNAGADIVMILGRSTTWDLAGLQQDFGPFTQTSFAILQVGDGELSSIVFAHELAHLFGCRHEPCVVPGGSKCDDIGPIEHAHVFKTGCFPNKKKRRTIMFSTADTKVIPHFSNPNVSYKGEATGETSRDNASILRNNACTMATAFAGGDQPLTVYILGKNYHCINSGNGISLSSIVYGGSPGTYTYEWRISNDGVNYGGIISTNQNLSISGPFLLGQIIWVRIKVISANNEINEDFFSIGIVFCEHGHLRPEKPNRFDEIVVFPNPAVNYTRCSFQLEKGMNVVLKITDFSGTPVKTIFDSTWLDSGYYEEPVDLIGIPQGIYNLRLLTGDKLYNSRIVKL
jgi:Metallo-peptidase family M12